MSGTVKMPAPTSGLRDSAAFARKARAMHGFPCRRSRLLTVAVSSPRAHCATHPAPARSMRTPAPLFPLMDA